MKEDDSLHQDVEFASGKVHLINTKESWDQKLEQARGDGKMVTFTFFFISSTKLSNVISTPIAIFLCCFLFHVQQVIANFSATWCGPCKMIAPYYCELSEHYPSIMFLLIDVDELIVSSEIIHSNVAIVIIYYLTGYGFV